MSSSLPLMAGCLVKSPPGLNGSVTTQSDLVCNTPQDCSPPRILPNSPVVTLFAKQPTNFVVASFSVHGWVIGGRQRHCTLESTQPPDCLSQIASYCVALFESTSNRHTKRCAHAELTTKRGPGNGSPDFLN